MHNKPTLRGLIFVGILTIFSIILISSSKNFVRAQTVQTITVNVYHLCDLAAINNVEIKCQFPFHGAGAKRSLLGPDDDFVLWPCQVDDPQNFPPYDPQMNYWRLVNL